jgi:hypothetical protein
MSTLYVDNLQPNLGSQVEIPNLKPLAGSVVQVVQGSTSSQTSITSAGSWFDITGNETFITPSSSSSKILVTVTQPFRLIATTGFMRGGFRVIRGSSTVVWNTLNYNENHQVRDANNEYNDVTTFSFLDSPATASQTSYRVQANLATGTEFRIYPESYGSKIILMEIAG